MIRHPFPGAARGSGLKVDRCFGVGVSGVSEHGVILVDGYRIGPGSPLAFDGGEQSLNLALPSFYRGSAEVLIATCPEDLAVLCRPRAPFYKVISQALSVAEAADTILVPFNGRARFYGALRYDGAAVPNCTVVTAMRHYWGIGDTDFDLDTLNTYTAANFVESVATGFEETERGDELVVTVTGDVGLTYNLSLWAHDEGT